MSSPAMAQAISRLYAQVDGPAGAARNLDALVDVLRDLSWLPAGPVELHRPEDPTLTPSEAARLTAVLRQVASETAGGRHPLHVLG